MKTENGFEANALKPFFCGAMDLVIRDGVYSNHAMVSANE